jgi:hypothetical protein
MNVNLDSRAELTIASACCHIINDRSDDAARVVNIFLNDCVEHEVKSETALESLARAGIKISLRVSEDNAEPFYKIISELTLSGAV